MKLIIDIPDDVYNRIIEEDWGGIMTNAIKNGTPYEERHKNIGCYICEACDRCYDAFMNHAIHCNNYAIWDKKEPENE